MWHTVLITLHAAAGLIALIAGLVALPRGQLLKLYLWALAGMLTFLVLAVAAEWQRIDPALRLLFPMFIALGAVMVWRGWLARRHRPSATAGPSSRYLGHLGFTLIALFDALVVVAVLNAGAPVWAVVASGVAIAVAGHYALRAVRARLLPQVTAAGARS